jgi:filamentous hemagglutinin family protein
MNKPCSVPLRVAGTIVCAAATLLAGSYMSSLLANPTGAQVVSGTVSVNAPAAGQMNITQKTPKAIVNWNTFSIGANEGVTIAQPSAGAALLNRVMGNDPSVIAGRLQANGKVFLVNPAGVIFAPGSSVNVGSMVASTLNISNADFLAGNYRFVGTSVAPVSNAGTLTAGTGGTIALLGGSVSNSGTVSARLGTVALGAGNDITLDFAGDGLTTLKINQGAANALIGNTGTLAADGGMLMMSAQTADALAGTVINQQGIVRAQSVAERNGHIVLDGGTSGVATVGGTLDATGGAGLTGGRIDVTGYNLALVDGARVDASGAAGGGTVRFGGGAAGQDPTIRNANALWMAPTASIHADALTNGNGGNVVAFSETASRIYGTLSARGGAQGGDGGLIETSGHYLDVTRATIDASAPKGKGGTWKIDPDNIAIVAAASGTPATETPPSNGSPAIFTPAGTDSEVVNSLITDQLNQGVSVTITTVGSTPTNFSLGDINIQAPIIAATPASPTTIPTLTLTALGSIVDNGQPIMSTLGPLSIALNGNVGGTNAFSSVAISNTTVTTNGGSFTVNAAGSSPVTINNSTVNTGGGALTLTGTTTLAEGTGVDITNSLLTGGAGTITLTGTPQGIGLSTGVSLFDSSLNTSTGGISIFGTTPGEVGTGVSIIGGFTPVGGTVAGPAVSSSGGAIAITGNATANGLVGLLVQGASVTNTTGAINLSGSVTGDAVPFVNGMQLFNANVGTSSGSIFMTGTVSSALTGSSGLDLHSTSVQSASGNIQLIGQSVGVPSGASVLGVFLENSPCECTPGPATSVTTGSGTLSIYGSGTGPFASGVQITDGTQIVSNNGGLIDIRGTVSGPAGGMSPNLQDDIGVLIADGAVMATGQTGSIQIAGSTNTADPGLSIGVPPSSGTSDPTISTAHPGSITLRASNDGSTSSLFISNSTLSSPGGTLSIMPATVDPNTFAIVAQNATPITLFGTGGLSIDAATFSAFSSIPNIVLGSTTQTGLITVNGVCASDSSVCVLTRPGLANNLTLSNPGSGSQGITLPFGLSTPGQTLALVSGGPVTDPGGIQAASLLLSGPGTFTLTDPQNDVGVLAMVNAGNVNFTNSHGFVIGPVVSQTFNSNTSQLTTLDGTNSTLTGNLIAQATTGNIGLGGPSTSLSAGGTIDLVMESGVFNAAGSGTIVADNGWRIWASTWVGETRGNVQPNTAQPNFYGCMFGAGCSWGGAVPTTGNHYVYLARPTVTVTADGKTRIAGAPNPVFTFTASGLINGDTAAGALTGTLTSPANQNSPPGKYPILSNLGSNVGYIVIEVPGTLTVTQLIDPVSQAGLQQFFSNQEQTFVYENNLQGTNICIGSNQPLFTTAPPGDTQDILAVEWKRVRSQPNLNSCMLLNGQHGCGDF